MSVVEDAQRVELIQKAQKHLESAHKIITHIDPNVEMHISTRSRVQVYRYGPEKPLSSIQTTIQFLEDYGYSKYPDQFPKEGDISGDSGSEDEGISEDEGSDSEATESYSAVADGQSDSSESDEQGFDRESTDEIEAGDNDNDDN